jgi:murein DD-endopeptidase MepM/ murein hydrolase activator NlpD
MRDQLSAVSRRLFCLSAALVAAHGTAAAQTIPSLPDSSGWGVHVLALARGPDSSLWVGTYGQGIFVLRPTATVWEHIQSSSDTSKHAISWDFVHAFGFGRQGEVWYGTVGNGWGVSVDGGRTWKNWELRQLGPEWQYVAPNGIVTRADTVYIATADGIKVTWDDGKTWRVITDLAGAATATDSVMGVIQNQYVLAIALGTTVDDNLWISDLKGIAHSPDGGRTWHEGFDPVPCEGKGCVNRARALLVDPQKRFWVGTELGLLAFGREFGGWNHPNSAACGALSCGATWSGVNQLIETGGTLYAASRNGFFGLRLGTDHDSLSLAPNGVTDPDPRTRMTTSVTLRDTMTLVTGGLTGVTALSVKPLGAFIDYVTAGTVASSGKLRHTWFRRPIDLADQPYIDQTYRFGSTMGGNFQPHQGVEFNNPDGTQVHAIGDGVVVYSGLAEAGSNTIAIRHDRQLKTDDGQRSYVFSVYYHNTKLLVAVGQKVKAGDVIALVGNTGRATNDHLHLEVHVAPTTDTSKIVAADVRYPPFNRNPELWIEPLPGTGVVAGQVWDGKGQPVPQAHVYGLVKPEPQETPFSFIETYGPRNHSDPVYQEHFAIGDVPPGTYTLGVAIDGKKVFRRVEVKAGKLTWVEFRP